MSENSETISVLGGGWSARGYDVNRLPGEVIAVNDSMIRARCDYGVSMDRLWVENRWDTVARMGWHGIIKVLYFRRAALPNVHVRPTFLHPFENDHKSVEFAPRGTGRLNGTNSGACALNLAANMNPRRVLLFGFDMNRSPKNEPYWYPPYEWAKPQGNTGAGTYQAWAREFDLIAAQFKARGVEVINCSLSSAIKSFPKADPKGFLV